MSAPVRDGIRRLSRIFPLCVAAVFAPHLLAVQATKSSVCRVNFPGSSATVSAAPMGRNLAVTVLPSGVAGKEPAFFLDGSRATAEILGVDPVSRLVFLKSARPLASANWRPSIGTAGLPSSRLLLDGVIIPSGKAEWVKQVGDKVLPFALLKMETGRSDISPGTAVLDSGGQIAAIVFQNAGGNRAVLAIPADAVHRVLADVRSHGRLVRGYVGLTLRPEVKEPRVVRVIDGSPAFAGGIQMGDTLLRIGDFPIGQYADVSNAFFYLTPGKSVTVDLIRSGRPLRVMITPTTP